MDLELLEADWRQASSSDQDQGDQGDEEENEDAPKKKTAIQPHKRSCDTCKRMKIKCERRGGDRCVHCIERDSPCETTLVARKKRSKRALPSSLSAMEDRIKRLESVLTLSGIEDHQSPSTDAGGTTAETPSDLADRLSDLLIDDSGGSRFIGASSGFTLFSPQGLQWISNMTGSSELSDFISSHSKNTEGSWPKSKLDIWHPVPMSDRQPLPPRELAEIYTQKFFDEFNSIFPLFDKASFDELIERHYSGHPLGSIEWYACFNVVLSLGSLCVGQTGSDGSRNYGQAVEDQSCGYFRNACGCFIHLMFRGCNLMALQAICGLSFIHHIFWNPQSIYILTAVAVRLAYAIGLHRKLDNFGFSQQESQQRCNVFWIVYAMDKTIAIRLGHPPSMVDDDIGVDLPCEIGFAEDYPDGSKRYNMFRCHAELAQLESRVYSELYSSRAQSKSTLSRLATVGQLDKSLQEWRLALPLEIRPGEAIQCSEEQLVPVSMMHFAYFHCLNTIHRSSIHHGSWTSDGARHDQAIHDVPNLNPRVYASQSICLTAARTSIRLLDKFEEKLRSSRRNLAWMAIYYPISSFLTLFANTLQNPENANATSDLELMNVVRSHLSMLSPQGHSFASRSVEGLFAELARVASAFVERTGERGRKPKRVYDTPEIAILESQMFPEDLNVSNFPTYPKYNSRPNSQIRSVRQTSSYPQPAHMSATPSVTPSPQQGSLDHPLNPRSNFEPGMLPLPEEAASISHDFYLNSQYIEWDLANIWYGPSADDYGSR